MRWMEIRINDIPVGLIVCLSIVFATQTANAGDPPFGVLAVDIDATGNDDGTSWSDAYTDLQDALDDAAINQTITQIWVAAGEYRPNPDDDEDRAATFTLINGVAIYGGFVGTESALNQRDPILNATRLIGSDDLNDPYRRYHVVTAIDVSPPTRLDGFIVQNAQANGTGIDQDIGGGILMQNANPLIIRCTFLHNKTEEGGGIYFDPGIADPLLEIINCEFDDNAGDGAPNHGGGMYNEGGRVNITNSFFHGNKVEGDGGAIYNDDGDLTVYSSTLVGNHADKSGGEGGGIFSTGANSSATLTNCILWENTDFESNSVEQEQITGTAAITYSCIEDDVEDDGNEYPGTGNIDLDPLFVGPPPFWGTPGANARLTIGSPCIDFGLNSAVELDLRDIDNDTYTNENTPDLDMLDRIVNIYVDMGAFEMNCPWDLNEDCAVSTSDLLILFAQRGTRGLLILIEMEQSAQRTF